MNANPLQIVSILFALSLLAAVVLFAFFKSTAIIKTPKYQAGGAIAGFVIVYSILQFSFDRISGHEARIQESEKEIENLRAATMNCEQFTATRDIAGTVNPYSDQIKVVLAVTATDLPSNGRF